MQIGTSTGRKGTGKFMCSTDKSQSCLSGFLTIPSPVCQLVVHMKIPTSYFSYLICNHFTVLQFSELFSSFPPCYVMLQFAELLCSVRTTLCRVVVC